MLGDSLLVAPIFNEDGIAEYYLPEGHWTSLLSGDVKEGGRWYKEKHGYLSIPLYVREGSIVARAQGMTMRCMIMRWNDISGLCSLSRGRGTDDGVRYGKSGSGEGSGHTLWQRVRDSGIRRHGCESGTHACRNAEDGKLCL